MRLLSIGEVLWDVFKDRESLGGAALNVCANLRRCGDEAALLSAVGQDARGSSALEAMKILGLSTRFVQTIDNRPTGTAFVSNDAHGETAFTIHRPAAFDAIDLSPETLVNLVAFRPEWIYLGTLLQTEPGAEERIHALLKHVPDARCFYDMNLRTGHWNLALVERLCALASVLKLNEAEAKTLAAMTGTAQKEYSLKSFCEAWAKRFDLNVICVTLGADGCCLYAEQKFHWLRGHSVEVSDTVGAGDAFAAAFLHGYHQGWPIAKCGRFANALGALVASRPGATPVWHMSECVALSVGPSR